VGGALALRFRAARAHELHEFRGEIVLLVDERGGRAIRSPSRSCSAVSAMPGPVKPRSTPMIGSSSGAT
jgi:hypothetical protein